MFMRAVVLAYKRPELTFQNISKLLSISDALVSSNNVNVFSSIVVVHDGLRNTEDKDSFESHKRVSQVIKDFENSQKRVTSITYSTNVGLTNHMFRILDDLGELSSDCVFIEEDKMPTRAGIEFLRKNAIQMPEIALLDTLPIHNHLGSSRRTIQTLFTDNGNLVISEGLKEVSRELWREKDKCVNDFETNLRQYVGSIEYGFGAKRAFDYFSRYYTWGRHNPDRPDSLLCYALIVKSRLKTSPNQRLTIDSSDRDTRGKNVISLPKNRDSDCHFSSCELWGEYLCAICERQGTSERVGLTIWASVRNRAKFTITQRKNNV